MLDLDKGGCVHRLHLEWQVRRNAGPMQVTGYQSTGGCGESALFILVDLESRCLQIK